MKADQLSSASKQELTNRAKALGIAGHASMKKDDLIKAITRALKKKEKEREKVKATKAKPVPAPAPASTPTPSVNGKGSPSLNGKHAGTNGTVKKAAKPETPATPTKTKPAEPAPTPVLSSVGKPLRTLTGSFAKDRVAVTVQDPYWLRVYWELSQQSIQRAEAALGQDWHGSKPVLRLCDVSSQDTTSTAEAVVRDVDIHGGCNNWYVEVTQPPKAYRVDIGYISKRGQFYVLARSNIVTPPKAGASDAIDENWSDLDAKPAERSEVNRVPEGKPSGRSSFDERISRPLNAPTVTNPMPIPLGKERKFFFTLDAEMIVRGRTIPGARVTIQGEPIKLNPDGTFAMRYSFPDGRQILPAVAETLDGVEERKIVLAVERNTKEMEPLIHDGNDNN